MIIGYGLKIKNKDELLLVEKEKTNDAYASVDISHKLIEPYTKNYENLDRSDSIYILNDREDAEKVANMSEIVPVYSATYDEPIIKEEWIGNLEVVEIVANRLMENDFGDMVSRTALLLHEAVSLGHSKEIKDLANLLVRDLRDFAENNFKESVNPYIKTIHSLKLEHLLNLCSDCIEQTIIRNPLL